MDGAGPAVAAGEEDDSQDVGGIVWMEHVNLEVRLDRGSGAEGEKK